MMQGLSMFLRLSHLPRTARHISDYIKPGNSVQQCKQLKSSMNIGLSFEQSAQTLPVDGIAMKSPY